MVRGVSTRQGPQRSNGSAIFGPIWPGSYLNSATPSVTDGDLGTAHARLAESILQLLARAGWGEPLLLLVDDAHRIDEGAVSLLHTLLNRRWARPVVVVLAYRTEAGGRRIEDRGSSRRPTPAERGRPSLRWGACQSRTSPR